MGRVGLLWVVSFSILGASLSGAADIKDFQARSQAMGAGKSLVYRLFVPKSYQSAKKYPLMLTLHGAGERGDNNTAQLLHDFNNMWAADSIQNPNPHFVVAPQCPGGSQWVNTPWSVGSYDSDKIAISEPMSAVVAILDSLAREFNLDADRIYVSGISMGGYGTWSLAMKYPGRFAAVVPVCGAADPKKAASLSNLPIWTFHAEDDGVVPVAGTREMVAALKAAGSAVKYTEYPKAMGINHLSWVPAGKTPELAPWLFQQSRKPVALKGRLQNGSGLRLEQGASRDGGSERADALGKLHQDIRGPTPGFVPPSP